MCIYIFIYKSSLENMFIDFLEREEVDRERDRYPCEKHGSVVSHTHPHCESNLQPRYVT